MAIFDSLSYGSGNNSADAALSLILSLIPEVNKVQGQAAVSDVQGYLSKIQKGVSSSFKTMGDESDQLVSRVLGAVGAGGLLQQLWNGSGSTISKWGVVALPAFLAGIYSPYKEMIDKMVFDNSRFKDNYDDMSSYILKKGIRFDTHEINSAMKIIMKSGAPSLNVVRQLTTQALDLTKQLGLSAESAAGLVGEMSQIWGFDKGQIDHIATAISVVSANSTMSAEEVAKLNMELLKTTAGYRGFTHSTKEAAKAQEEAQVQLLAVSGALSKQFIDFNVINKGLKDINESYSSAGISMKAFVKTQMNLSEKELTQLFWDPTKAAEASMTVATAMQKQLSDGIDQTMNHTKEEQNEINRNNADSIHMNMIQLESMTGIHMEFAEAMRLSKMNAKEAEREISKMMLAAKDTKRLQDIQNKAMNDLKQFIDVLKQIGLSIFAVIGAKITQILMPVLNIFVWVITKLADLFGGVDDEMENIDNKTRGIQMVFGAIGSAITTVVSYAILLGSAMAFVSLVSGTVLKNFIASGKAILENIRNVGLLQAIKGKVIGVGQVGGEILQTGIDKVMGKSKSPEVTVLERIEKVLIDLRHLSGGGKSSMFQKTDEHFVKGEMDKYSKFNTPPSGGVMGGIVTPKVEQTAHRFGAIGSVVSNGIAIPKVEQTAHRFGAIGGHVGGIGVDEKSLSKMKDATKMMKIHGQEVKESFWAAGFAAQRGGKTIDGVFHSNTKAASHSFKVLGTGLKDTGNNFKKTAGIFGEGLIGQKGMTSLNKSVDVIGTGFTKIGNTAKTGAKTAGDALIKLGPKFKDIGGKVKEGASTISKAFNLDPVWKKVSGSFDKFMNTGMVKSVGKGVSSAIKTIGAAMPGVTGAITKFAGAATESVAGVVNTAMSGIGEAMVGNVSFIEALVPALFSPVGLAIGAAMLLGAAGVMNNKDAWMKSWNEGDIAGAIGGVIKGFFKGLTVDLFGYAVAAMEFIVKAIFGGDSDTYKAFKQFTDTMMRVFNSVFNIIWKVIKLAFVPLRIAIAILAVPLQAIFWLFGKVFEGIAWVFDKIGGFIDSVVKAIDGFISFFTDGIQLLVDLVKSIFTGNFSEVLGKIGEHIWKGIKAFGGLILDVILWPWKMALKYIQLVFRVDKWILGMLWSGVKSIFSLLMWPFKMWWAAMKLIFRVDKWILGMLWSGVKSIWAVLTWPFRKAWEWITSLFSGDKSIGLLILDGLKAISGFIIDVLLWPFKKIWNFIGSLFGADNLGSMIVDGLKAIGGFIIDVLTWPFRKVWGWISGLFGSGEGKGIGLLILDGLKSIGSYLFDVITAPFKKAWEWIKGLFGGKGIGSLILSGLESVVEAVGSVIGSVVGGLGTAVSAVGNVVGSITGGVTDIIGSAVSGVSNMISSDKEKITNSTDLTNSGKSAATDLTNTRQINPKENLASTAESQGITGTTETKRSKEPLVDIDPIVKALYELINIVRGGQIKSRLSNNDMITDGYL
jgi:phage-related protein